VLDIDAIETLEEEAVEETSPLPFPVSPVPRTGPASGPPAPFRLAPRARRAHARLGLPLGSPLFDWLGRRFAAGQLTLWSGPRAALDPLLELLYAGNALGRGRISLLEGSNRFDPYRLGDVGRSLGTVPEEVLERIRLARSFTAYQMVALVDAWSAEARRHPPTLLVGHDLPDAFTIDEIPEDERAALLRHVAGSLRTLVESLHLPLLLTLDPAGASRFPGLADAGPPWCDLVTFARGPGTLTLRSLRDNARLSLVPRRRDQRGIEEFGGGAVGEVIAWDAPSRPTARRWSSG
jgi:hypothetical protein